MQKKVNQLSTKDGKVYTDVLIIESDEGVYVEYEDIIGTDKDGGDIVEKNLIMYPWENILFIKWNEPTLIDMVKESVFSNMYEELEDLLESFSENEEGEDNTVSEDTRDTRDSPAFNPYDKKE